jgi:hypothetical protein
MVLADGSPADYHPPEGDDAPWRRLHTEVSKESGLEGYTALMTRRTYEITVAGQAVPAVVGAFEDFEVVVGAECTTLRAELPDQAALHGAIDRVQALGLELLEVRPVEDPSP